MGDTTGNGQQILHAYLMEKSAAASARLDKRRKAQDAPRRTARKRTSSTNVTPPSDDGARRAPCGCTVDQILSQGHSDDCREQ